MKMARPPIDLLRRIKDILQHVQTLPQEANAPLLHYRRTSTDFWNSILYVERTFDQGKLYPTVANRHLGRIYGMTLVNLVEAFERFLKEIAAVCVDRLGHCVLDDRFDVFPIQGSRLASHFGTGTLGKSLCESSTWLDCEEINKRFRKLLSDPFQVGGQSFDLFPKATQQPEVERWRYEPMSIVWQIRHTAVHNVGVITQSDAAKLRILAREAVASPRILAPTRNDLRYLKRFLDETAESCNQRIGQRLAELLTMLHVGDTTLFVPQEMADGVSQTFGTPLTIAGAVGVIPPL
jgi:hypothetical protein